MLQYSALKEQAFCFPVTSSFDLHCSDVQIFLQVGGTVYFSALSYCKLLSWGLQTHYSIV